MKTVNKESLTCESQLKLFSTNYNIPIPNTLLKTKDIKMSQDVQYARQKTKASPVCQH